MERLIALKSRERRSLTAHARLEGLLYYIVGAPALASKVRRDFVSAGVPDTDIAIELYVVTDRSREAHRRRSDRSRQPLSRVA